MESLIEWVKKISKRKSNKHENIKIKLCAIQEF